MAELRNRGFLRRIQTLRQVLGFDEDPLQDIRSAQMIESTRQANVARAMTQERAERQFEHTKQFDGYKLAFGQLTKFYESTPEGPKREYITNLMESLLYNAPVQVRAALRTTSFLRPISPEEKRGREFRKTHKRPEWPTGSDGLRLPWTEENEPALAHTMIGQIKFDNQEAIVKYGKDAGSAMKPVPKVYPGYDFVDKETGVPKAGTARMYIEHPDTGQIYPMSADAIAQGVTTEQLREREETWFGVMTKGSVPLAKPTNMTLAGTSARVTPRQDFEGKVKNEVLFLGAEPPKVNIPAGLEQAWVTAAMGDEDMIDKLDDPWGEVARRFLDPVKFDNADNLLANIQEVNRMIQPLAPNIRAFIPFKVDEKTGAITLERDPKKRGFWSNLFGETATYQTDGFPWVMVPVEGTMRLNDGKGGSGTFYRGITKTGESVAIQENGTILPGSVGAQDNDTIDNVTMPKTELPPEVPAAERRRLVERQVRQQRRGAIEIETERGREQIIKGAKILASWSVSAIAAVLQAFGELPEKAEKQAAAFKKWSDKTGGSWDDYLRQGKPGYEK